MPTYECDKCGACCKHLLIEAHVLDALREPRLLAADVGGKRVRLQVLLDDPEGSCVILGGVTKPCHFLGADDQCTIYPTRPNVCVGLQAGDEQCQEARGQSGLPPLQPLRRKSKGATSC